jgi:hypothetical protein
MTFVYRYPIGTYVHCKALGKDPPFDGIIYQYNEGDYIIFDSVRSKQWVRPDSAIEPIINQTYPTTVIS